VNLLNRAYVAAAPGVRWVCLGANIMLLAFSVVMAVLMRPSVLGMVLVFGLNGGLTLSSRSPGSS
jgi:hypothetical protein